MNCYRVENLELKIYEFVSSSNNQITYKNSSGVQITEDRVKHTPSVKVFDNREQALKWLNEKHDRNISSEYQSTQERLRALRLYSDFLKQYGTELFG